MPMKFKDYYDILGVEPSAGAAEIKTAYRKLARKYHPDVSKEPDAEEQFKSVNEAYEVLGNEEKRKHYDQLKARGYRPGDEFQQPPHGHGGQPFDFQDIFGQGGGAGGAGFSDFFESLFGGAGAPRGRPPGGGFHQGPPKPKRLRLQVDLEQVHQGATVQVSMDGRSIKLKIPKGIEEGKSMRVAGKNGQPDVLLNIHYRTHPHFEVDGRNTVYTLPVMPWQAALGDSMAVPTLGGTVDVRVPKGANSGMKLRLKGRGLPVAGADSASGDQLVLIEVQAPKPETDEQTTAYEALKAAFNQTDSSSSA